MKDGDMEPYDFAPEKPDPDVHDSNPHGCRYSRDACSPDMCISCL